MPPPGAAPAASPAEVATPPEAGCARSDGCLTCGDVAVELAVLAVHGADAECRDAQGRRESVALELVGGVRPGDRVLVHAGVALELLTTQGW